MGKPAFMTCLACLLTALVGTACHSTHTVHSDMGRRYPVKEARLVEAKDGSGRKMYDAQTTAPSFVGKKGVRSPKDQAAPIARTETRTAEKLDPEKVGAKKLSMQDYNRYAYGKRKSGDSTVPVTQAGAGEAVGETDEASVPNVK